jgi:hypothetical protein
VRASGVANADDYRKRLSGRDIHQMLRSKIEAWPYMGGVNVIDADGDLINSSVQKFFKVFFIVQSSLRDARMVRKCRANVASSGSSELDG